jgi:uncharacterized protein
MARATHDWQSSAGRPVAALKRIVGIDILRGIALFGVLAINVVTEFRVSIFQQFLPDQGGGILLDGIVHKVLMVGIDLKALAIFSLLFGAGLAIQFDQLVSHPRRITLLIRRLLVLLLIGIAHLVLVWNGDILIEYAGWAPPAVRRGWDRFTGPLRHSPAIGRSAK